MPIIGNPLNSVAFLTDSYNGTGAQTVFTMSVAPATSSSIYCVYLTTYQGNKLPPFYIGSSTIAKVNAGYRGSVSSIEYKAIWQKELKAHPELFLTSILTTHETNIDAVARENKLHVNLKVINNPLYINKATAFGHFSSIREKEARNQQKVNITKRMNDPVWITTVGLERQRKISATKQTQEWKETEGKRLSKLAKERYQNKEWVDTVWADASERRKKTRSNPEWIRTVWAEQNRKTSEKKLSQEWKDLVGIDAYKKVSVSVSKTVNSLEWKQANYKTCPSCSACTNPGNYAKHHGIKCKTLKAA